VIFWLTSLVSAGSNLSAAEIMGTLLHLENL